VVESQVAERRTEMILAAPAPDLRSLITGYTGYRIQGEPAGVHRGLPSRSLTVVLTIEGTVDIGGARRARGYGSYRALASGLHDEVVLIEHDGNQYGLQADLTPLGARALLGLPAGALAGAIVDLDALLGPAAGELIDRLRAAPTWPERFEHLDSVLSRVANPTDVPAGLAWVWRRLTGSGGALPIGALATEVGWSRQHLGSQFQREFGLSPKRAARVIRFESAHRLLAASPRSRIADIAARCGYYDQAHLDRDWRALTGLSPTAWLSHELPFVQDGTADER
jgi:AraC-like DNA-binding protein